MPINRFINNLNLKKMNIQSVNMSQHTANVMSQIAESGTQNRIPEVNMPVTINYYTDRIAGTITQVISESKIMVKENEVITLDYYRGEYAVLPELKGEHTIFTKRKNGRWVKQGEGAQKGLGLSLGIHDHYIDPNF